MKQKHIQFGVASLVAAFTIFGASCGDSEDDKGSGDSGGSGGSGSAEDKMAGHWEFDTDKMVVEAKKHMTDEEKNDPNAAANMEMMKTMMGFATVEFKKGEVTIHGPQGPDSKKYTVKSSDANSITMEVEEDGKPQEGTATIKGDTLTLSMTKDGKEENLFLNRITKAESEKRAKEAAEALKELLPPQP